VSAVNDAVAGASASPADPPAEGTTTLLTLPRPTHTRVRTADYTSSAVDLAGCPPASVPEFALIGRSNVGKSSLINALTGRKALAQVSKQPGKTRTINHFLINGAGPAPWYLVDLPGYGYARAGATHRLAWASFSQAFFLERATLATVLLLADGTLPPQAADLECAAWLAGAGVPFCVVLTKADKRVKARASLTAEQEADANADGTRVVSGAAANAAALAAALADRLGGPSPAILATSAATGAGRNEVLNYIAQVRALATAGGGGGAGVAGGGGKAGGGGAPDGVPDDEWW
jgi:GTP-binding protein